MKGNIIIIGFFIAGILLGLSLYLPDFLLNKDLSTYMLYILMFLVGVMVGADKLSFSIIREVKFEILVVPIFIIVGTFVGVSIVSLLLDDINLKGALAVGAGFGYYSLSSIIITEMEGEALGTLALLANIMREIFTLLFAPILVMFFGKLAPIASGGATSMDSTLPVVRKYSGTEYSIISVYSGIVLTILVPIFVTFILKYL